ncbi:MAG: hypothetical protein KKB30_13605 [Proteobacteria bacterium]|nr:hypothetical protein [Pseudomonadota bacterium]MBU1717386.1 hypothetical protein [Pseudomonadota bacterium]
MARWYDKHEKLRKNIDKLKFSEKNFRDYLLSGVMVLIKKHRPRLLEDFVQDFPLEIHRRRWYDKDPYLWLIINGLRHADQELLDEVASYMEAEQEKAASNTGLMTR